MFCFITSLRARAVSEDWSRVCELFERAAISVFNQTSPDFRLITVCHDLPILRREFDKRLELIQADTFVPERGNWPQMMDDKVGKLLLAMRRARELQADFVMPMDSDDLVSRRIVAHALANPDSDGWYIGQGYRYQYGQTWIETLPDFGRICGTANIVARRWFAFPGLPEREASADDMLIAQGFGQVVEALGNLGGRLRPLPFNGAVYMVCNGENMSNLHPYPSNGVRRRRSVIRTVAGYGKRMTMTWLKRRPCTRRLRQEFALNTSPLGSLK